MVWRGWKGGRGRGLCVRVLRPRSHRREGSAKYNRSPSSSVALAGSIATVTMSEPKERIRTKDPCLKILVRGMEIGDTPLANAQILNLSSDSAWRIGEMELSQRPVVLQRVVKLQDVMHVYPFSLLDKAYRWTYSLHSNIA